MTAGTFTLSNLGMFGVDRFDAILPPGQVRNSRIFTFMIRLDSSVPCSSFAESLWNNFQGAIIAVGASKPTVIADADGFFSVKSKMLVSIFSVSL